MERILPTLNGLRKTGNGQWEARCPCHDDNRASLSVGRGDNGQTLLHCHAGCATADIVAALGLKMSDLAPDNGNGRPAGKPEIVKLYDYQDESGELLFQVCRMRPKDFRQRAPRAGGGWSWSTKGIRKVLYRLPELLAADATELVFILEGEKDVDRLAGLGLVGTCNAGGAGKWHLEYAEHLRGRQVVILPDNDTAGRKHADQVAASLQDVAGSVKVLALPDLPTKGDVSDFLDAGGTPERLLELAAAAVEWESTPPHPDALPLTDTGLAERFARQHVKSVRFCWPWSKWLVWDGRRWARDQAGDVDQLAKKTARAILVEAAGEPDGDRCKELASFALRSESATRRAAMLNLSRSEPGIPVLPDTLDTDPWALNLPNGTLDLRTGDLREHRRGDHLTKLCPVEFHPDAESPTWHRFLEDIFRADAELIGFVQRLLGYCLTGAVTEQVLPIFYGTGSNGKSTLVNVVLEMLGADYAMKAPGDLLLAKRNDSHPTERADLHGMRFVACLESDEGRRLAEALTKDLTGGDKIRARRMREDYFEFVPSHKLILASNHKPAVKGTDHAMWRRIRLVPFSVTVADADQDKQLPEKLTAELPGILAWSVRGCLEWQRDGLQPCGEVIAATKSYRNEEDSLAEFFDERCILHSDACVPSKDLYAAYRKHMEENGERSLSRRRFGARMSDRDFERYTNNGVWYRGIDLHATE